MVRCVCEVDEENDFMIQVRHTHRNDLSVAAFKMNPQN